MPDGAGRPATSAGGVGPRIAACALVIGVGVLVTLLVVPGVGTRAAAGDDDGRQASLSPQPTKSAAADDFKDRLPDKDRTGRLDNMEPLRLRVDGEKRKALVYVPSRVRKDAPAFVAVHGYTSSAQAVISHTSYVDLAERNGWILAVPQGLKYPDGQRAWNAGNCCGGAPAADTDDVEFVEALGDALVDRFSADRERLFYNGYSNGAMLGYRIACQAEQPFSGFALLSGTLVSPCEQSAEVPVLAIHGLRDGTVPYTGSRWRVSLQTTLPPVVDAIDTLAALNGCRGEVRGKSPRDGQIRVLRAGCSDRVEVQLVTVANMTHQWTEDVAKYGINETTYSTRWLLAQS